MTAESMKLYRLFLWLAVGLVSLDLAAAPVIDPIPSASIPAGKSLTIPITATSPNGRPLAYTVTSSTSSISGEVHTNNPFWKMSVVQVAPANAPGAYQTPFRGGLATVTNIGEMTFLLLRPRAPRTVDTMAALTTSGFYNSNTIFHRVVLSPYTIIQGGDPNTNGLGGPVFRYDDEIHPRALFTGSGQLGAANSGPDSSGSQFFITGAPQRGFDLRYTIFGQLLRGFHVLSNVLNTATDANSRPQSDVIITRASLVTNITDTAITLTATNLAGASSTIQIIADDGLAGGRVTNSFTASSVADSFNLQPYLNISGITNRLIPVNGSSTNFTLAQDLEGNPIYYDAYFVDNYTFNNASNSIFDGGIGKFVVIPNAGYTGPLRFYTAVAPNPFFTTYDFQQYTFTVGDSAISASGTNFSATPQFLFTNQLLATFTNGVANSPSGSFAAAINWGDNSVTTGTIATNASGRKEVRGSHTYTNSGNYPVYVTIQSALGTSTTVIANATARPGVSLTRTANAQLIKWPAWAADFQIQTTASLNPASWITVTNLVTLVGYENVITNIASASNQFFRLQR